MTSDLPSESGPLDPGLDQLFRTLTSGPTPAELAGERSALSMFRASISPPASPATAPIRAGRPAADPKRSVTRLFRRPGGWGIRLAAAMVVVLAVAMAAAAYTAVLPAPVQLLAHRVLGFAGVPEPRHHAPPAASSAPHAHHTGAPSGHRGSAPGKVAPTESASGHSPPAHPSASPSSSAASGPAQLSASVSSTEITAGSGLVVDGQLTRSGAGVQGTSVELIERVAGHLSWHLAGTAQTTAGGNVAVTVAVVPANTVFRLRVPGVAHSTSVLVTVIPPVTVELTEGPSGLEDVLTVSTQYASRGDVVWLEVQTASGWTYLRERRLTAAGTTSFVLSGKRLQNRQVRVVLLATARHGASVGNSETVPPPS